MKHRNRAGLFSRTAAWTSHAMGHPLAFTIAVGMVLAWGFSGPVFEFSDTWQLYANTGTTLATFLMVFLIQHSTNHDAQVLQIKLDELIRAMPGAHNALLDLDELNDVEIRLLQLRYLDLAIAAREALRQGIVDTGQPDMRYFENGESC